MKKSFLLISVIFFVSFMFASTPEKLAEVDNLMLEKAKQFKDAIATSKGYRSGVYIYQRRSVTDYQQNPEKLVARLALLGFTDIYLGVNRWLNSGNRDEEKWLTAFNTTAHGFGMKVHILTLSSSKLWVDNKRIYDDVKNVIDFNYTNKKEVRFDGISADLEPHIMKKGHVERPKELLWEWHGTDNYGVGNDNDKLCERMVDVMARARKEMGKKLEFSQAQGFFIQGRYDKGELSWGSAHQMLEHVDQLIVMAYNFRPTRVLEMARPTLENAIKFPKSISIAVKTSLDTYGSEGPVTSFLPQGWDYMIEGLKFLVEKASEYPSFRGIDIFEFQGLEKMWDGTAVVDKRTNYEKTDSH